MAYKGVETRPDGSLYCDISIESLGFMSFTPLCSLPIQYNGDKFREMGELFVGYARTTCPVDTGYLRDHNDYHADKGGIEMWSSAFYSAYQEYGTSRCRAQPWFESSIQTALADSGIEDDFEQTQTRFCRVDGELASIQASDPYTINECYNLIDRIKELKQDMADLGLHVEGLDEMIVEIETRIDFLMQQMMSQPPEMLGFFEELIIMIIAGMLGALIRSIMEHIFESNKDVDANPHNPSH